MATKDEKTAQQEVEMTLPMARDIIIKDVSNRLMGTVRFGAGKDWLREAAEASAEKRAATIVKEFTDEATMMVANYIKLVSK